MKASSFEQLKREKLAFYESMMNRPCPTEHDAVLNDLRQNVQRVFTAAVKKHSRFTVVRSKEEQSELEKKVSHIPKGCLSIEHHEKYILGKLGHTASGTAYAHYVSCNDCLYKVFLIQRLYEIVSETLRKSD